MFGGNGRTSTPVPRRARLRAVWRAARQAAAGCFAQASGVVIAVAWAEYRFRTKPQDRQALLDALTRSLPQMGARRIRRVARRILVHRALTRLEWAHAEPPAAPRSPAAEVAIDGLEYVAEALRLGRGALVYAPAQGDVRVAFRALAQRHRCLLVVAGAPARKGRALGFAPPCDRLGPAEVIQIGKSDDTAFARIRRHLKEGGVVFLVGDAIPSEWRAGGGDHQGGLQADEPVTAAAVRLALDDAAPLVPCLARRQGWYRHRLLFEPPRHLYERYAVAQRSAAVGELRRLVEAAILEAPEQWWGWG